MSEESGITYEQKGDYYYPVFAETKQTCYPIGKYGNLRLTFIKEHRKGTYTTLLTTGRLNEYLYKVDMEAKETVRRLTAEFAKARGIDEKLKSKDSLRWVQEMNNCKACAEEIVMEAIYG